MSAPLGGLSAPRLSRVEHACLKSIAAGRFRYVGGYHVIARILERRGLVRVVVSARDSARVELTALGWRMAAEVTATDAMARVAEEVGNGRMGDSG